MKKAEVQQLVAGLYEIHWKKKHGGKKSLAAIGYNKHGNMWFLPCNWTAGDDPNKGDVCFKWNYVKKVVLIRSLHSPTFDQTGVYTDEIEIKTVKYKN